MSDRCDARTNPAARTAAWRQFRRMVHWMIPVAIVAVVAAFLYLKQGGGVPTLNMVIATAGGGLPIALGTRLILLAFLSDASGYDTNIGQAAGNIGKDDE